MFCSGAGVSGAMVSVAGQGAKRFINAEINIEIICGHFGPYVQLLRCLGRALATAVSSQLRQRLAAPLANVAHVRVGMPAASGLNILTRGAEPRRALLGSWGSCALRYTTARQMRS